MQSFISYKRQDEAFARRLHAYLHNAGLNVWLDVVSIRPGDNWDDAIHAGLRGSDVVIGVLTPESLASRNVLDEWGYALTNDMPLFLLWLRPINEKDIPPRYIRIQRIDVMQDEQAGLARLRDQLAELTDPARAPGSSHPNMPAPPAVVSVPPAPDPAPASHRRIGNIVQFQKSIAVARDVDSTRQLARAFFQAAGYKPTADHDDLSFRRGTRSGALTTTDPHKGMLINATAVILRDGGLTRVNVTMKLQIMFAQVMLASDYAYCEAELDDLEDSLIQGQISLSRSEQMRHKSERMGCLAQFLQLVALIPALAVIALVPESWWLCFPVYLAGLIFLWLLTRRL